MNDIPATLIYIPYELEKFLDDTSVPLSDDEIVIMSAYFNEKNQCTTDEIFDIIKVEKR